MEWGRRYRRTSRELRVFGMVIERWIGEDRDKKEVDGGLCNYKAGAQRVRDL